MTMTDIIDVLQGVKRIGISVTIQPMAELLRISFYWFDNKIMISVF